MDDKNRSAIYGAIVGALFSAVCSLALGLYSLHKNFEMTIEKELVNQLRKDINMLRIVESQIAENIALLLNENIVPEIREKAYRLPFWELLNESNAESNNGGFNFEVQHLTVI